MVSSKEVAIKVFLIFFCVIVTVIQAGVLDRGVEPLTRQEAGEIWESLIEKCGYNKLPAERDMQNLTSEEVQKIERKRKCAGKCSMLNLGFMTDDNQLNRTGIMRMAAGVPKIECQHNAFYEKCSYIKDSDSCEYAWKVNECYKAVTNSRRLHCDSNEIEKYKIINVDE